ncbi:MAG: zf-HC2 domain-containing protein [Acidiferrobacterales bacterium]
MQCQTFKSMLDEYLDGTLGVPVREEMVRHADSCQRCRQELKELEFLREGLREMPVLPARENFTREAFAAAVGKGVSRNKPAPGFMHWFGAGFVGAMVAGLVLWSLATTFLPSQPHPAKASFNIALYQPKKISLAFNAPADISNVTVSIELPSQFEVVGHAGRQTLSWQTNLKKGRNILTLPVVAKSEGKGVMIARLSRNKETKTLHILLTSGKPGLSQYRVTGEKVV